MRDMVKVVLRCRVPGCDSSWNACLVVKGKKPILRACVTTSTAGIVPDAYMHDDSELDACILIGTSTDVARILAVNCEIDACVLI